MLGVVCTTPTRLLSQSEFTALPSCGFDFVFLMPPDHVIPERMKPARVHRIRFYTAARISFRDEISHQHYVNEEQALVVLKRANIGCAYVHFKMEPTLKCWKINP